jgi:phosphoglycolate phosphatase
MPRRLAMFDFDGTLANSLPWFRSVLDDIADCNGFRRIPPDEAEELRRLPPREGLKRLGLPLWRVPAIAADLRERKARADIPLFDGATDLLEQLAGSGVTLAVISSDTEPTIREALGAAAAHIRHFDCSASLFGKAAKIRRLLKATGVPALQAIYIGDEVRDAEACAKAGVPFGAVAWGYAAPEALIACTPAEMFETLPDILRIAG